MAFKEYKPGTTFPGRIGRTFDESSPAWPQPRRAKDGAPNVLFIVQDDTGFGQIGCYGSPIETPNIDALAKGGLLFNNMHTTALCSPSRSCFLTGRNHHSNAMACITEGSEGFPGSNGNIPFENGMLSEMLLAHGYNTYALGKWHLSPADQISAAGPYDRWPLGRGFERYYGFLAEIRINGIRTWSTTITRRTAENTRRRLSSNGRSRRQSDRFYRRLEASSAKQTVLSLFRAGREACTAPCPEGMGRQIQRKVRRRLGRLSREDVREAETARRHSEGRQALAPRSRRPGMAKLPADERKLYARMMEVFAGFCVPIGPPRRTAHRFSRQRSANSTIR